MEFLYKLFWYIELICGLIILYPVALMADLCNNIGFKKVGRMLGNLCDNMIMHELDIMHYGMGCNIEDLFNYLRSKHYDRPRALEDIDEVERQYIRRDVERRAE